MRGQVGIRQACDFHGANLRKKYLPRTVNAKVRLKIDLSPDSNAQLIAGADDEVRWDRGHIKWSEGRWNIQKQVRSEDRQNLARGGSNELLKLGKGLWLRWYLPGPVFGLGPLREARDIEVVTVWVL
jgi:hypothetical protein